LIIIVTFYFFFYAFAKSIHSVKVVRIPIVTIQINVRASTTYTFANDNIHKIFVMQSFLDHPIDCCIHPVQCQPGHLPVVLDDSIGISHPAVAEKLPE
jgi:hypothetical protein